MGVRGESTTVRFVVDPSELEELGLSPSRVFGPSGQAPPMPQPGDMAGGSEPKGGSGGGGGLMTAAVVGALTGGIIGMVQFFGQLLQNSKILNTYAQSFGKVFSAALDMLLMPFIPVLNLMLAGVMKLVAWLITSGYLERMSAYVNTVMVPLMEAAGQQLRLVWDLMNNSADPSKWDWEGLGLYAGGVLLQTLALITADINLLLAKIGLPIGDPYLAAAEEYNAGLAMQGKAPISQAQFVGRSRAFNDPGYAGGDTSSYESRPSESGSGEWRTVGPQPGDVGGPAPTLGNTGLTMDAGGTVVNVSILAHQMDDAAAQARAKKRELDEIAKLIFQFTLR